MDVFCLECICVPTTCECKKFFFFQLQQVGFDCPHPLWVSPPLYLQSLWVTKYYSSALISSKHFGTKKPKATTKVTLRATKYTDKHFDWGSILLRLNQMCLPFCSLLCWPQSSMSWEIHVVNLQRNKTSKTFRKDNLAVLEKRNCWCILVLKNMYVFKKSPTKPKRSPFSNHSWGI